ncbi:MAG: hypothetical protein H7Z75_01595 [Ferruginibacter sp.]|nr:hypothetical protein [Cytophagales bacterium]
MKKTKGIWGGGLLLLATCLPGCDVADVFPNAEPRERPITKITDDYERHEYVPAARKTDILREDFNDNRRGWPVVSGSNQYSTRVIGGQLEIASWTSLRPQNSIDLPDLKGTDNFEIEARIEVDYASRGYSGSGDALLWGSTATLGQWLYYGINNYSSEMAIGAYDGQRYQENNFPTSSPAVFYRDAYNTLLVRKVNNTCYYFLNGGLLTKRVAAPFYGSRIGFGADAYSTVRVEFLRVSRLNLN